MNNIQIAVARIHNGISWLKEFLIDLFNGNLGKRGLKAKEARASIKLQPVANHMEGNGIVGVIGRYGEKYTVPEEDSYMTNPNLTISVPIAPGESDVEFLEEEEEISESSEDEENKPVNVSTLISIMNCCDWSL